VFSWEDKSVHGTLLAAGGILGLFLIYFLLAYLNNRTVRSLATRLRRGRSKQQADRVQTHPLPGGSFRLMLFITTVILAVSGLFWWFASRAP